jgi:hypothetical protein
MCVYVCLSFRLYVSAFQNESSPNIEGTFYGQGLKNTFFHSSVGQVALENHLPETKVHWPEFCM